MIIIKILILKFQRYLKKQKMYNPKYEISNKLLNYLSRINAAHNLITNVPLIPK